DNEKKDDFVKARSIAYRMLAARRRTGWEVERRLQEKGFEPEVSRRVVDCLKNYGFIDDAEFARCWVDWRLGKSGAVGLRRELSAKGVAPEIIDKTLGVLDDEAEYKAALALAKKQMTRRGGNYPLLKLAGFLERRGYSYDVVGRICRTLVDKSGFSLDSF
ncbi:MAG: recombination regulator RecX, partial [Firmicutes bacterium]|nr:recombination regulator RecX [Bacillota bacterium]